MSQLNANASEWRPSGNPAAAYLADFALPPASEPPADTRSLARTNGLSVDSPAFIPGRPGTISGTPAPITASVAAAPYYPTFTTGAAADAVGGVLGDVDWKVEFGKVMKLTEQMIEQQLHPVPNEADAAKAKAGATTSGAGGAAAVSAPAPAAAATTTSTATTPVAAAPATPTSASKSPAPAKTYAAAVAGNTAEKRAAATATTAAPSHGVASGVSSMAPLTANGNRRWKKPTKAQQKRELAQRNAFEAFASALLHTVSPFMAPLRAKCHKALPHLKIDQRFGKSGQPQTAVAQFIAAPLVNNYRPRHFHDLSPGDLEEFMWDLAQVLGVMPSSYSLIVGYGPVWKRYAVPYLYIACKDYAREVLSLCPDEVPNARAEAMYEDDVVKDITDVILAVEELDFLMGMSLVDAMKARMKFQPMFDALDQIFAPLENYQIELTNLRDSPSRFLIKVSQLQVNQQPHPIVLYKDPQLWNGLPVVSRVVVKAARGAGSGADAGVARGSRGTAASEGSDNDSGGNDEEGDEEDMDAGLMAGHAAKTPEGSYSPSGAAARAGSSHAGGATSTNRQPHGSQGRETGRGGSGNGMNGVPMWLVVTPVVLSVLCTAATVGFLLSKRAK